MLPDRILGIRLSPGADHHDLLCHNLSGQRDVPGDNKISGDSPGGNLIVSDVKPSGYLYGPDVR